MALTCCLLWPGFAQPTPSTHTPITAEELLTKVRDRARQQNSQPPRREFIRTRTTLELDKHNNVKEREELTYRMVIHDGSLYPRLIRKNGQILNPEEQRKETEKETRFKSDRVKDATKEEGNTALFRLSEETAKRFDYAIAGSEQVNGRVAHIVTVTPKSSLRAKTIEEQVMARISGRLWIDQRENEIVKLQVQLLKSVGFGAGGLLGALNKFDFSLSRNRRGEDDWENTSLTVRLQFRIFLDTHRVHYEEKISDLPPGG